MISKCLKKEGNSTVLHLHPIRGLSMAYPASAIAVTKEHAAFHGREIMIFFVIIYADIRRWSFTT